jgi:putative tricarboxylic transport membrane protein
VVWIVPLLVGVSCSPSQQSRGWECIAPANAGGGWDRTCRSAATVLEELALAPGQVRTTNLPGAGGAVAYARVVGQRSDDPSLLVAASPGTTLLLAQGQYGNLTEEDVRWVGALGAEYGMLAVAADAPWQTLDDLVRAWRSDPGSIVVSGGSAVAGQDHMKVLLVAQQAGLDPRSIRYVPFDGGGEAMTALLGGFVDVFSGEASEVEGQVRAGRLRVLTVLAPERLEGFLADVPTASEAGLDVTWVTWRGFFAPGDISDERYGAWVQALDSLGRSGAWARMRQANRLEPFLLVGAAFEEFISEEVEEFRAVARDIGLVR